MHVQYLAMGDELELPRRTRLVENPANFPTGGAQMVRRILAFLVAIAALVVFGTIAQSLSVQRAWLNAAVQSGVATDGIALLDRLRWIGHDLIGLLPTYGALTAIALLLGLLAAGGITRFTGQRRVIYALAGAACMFTLFTILKAVLGTVGVFGARGGGLMAQVLVGLAAALLFAQMTEPPPKAKPANPATIS
jgi:hypothetical protein